MIAIVLVWCYKLLAWPSSWAADGLNHAMLASSMHLTTMMTDRQTKPIALRTPFQPFTIIVYGVRVHT